tara:strand:- start:29 stop:262 length:234 start_codon:yes stop_codon:yes gene_type:complete
VAVPRRSIQQAGIEPSKENIVEFILPEISTPNRIQTHKKVTKDAQSSPKVRIILIYKTDLKKQIQIDSKNPMPILAP